MSDLDAVDMGMGYKEVVRFRVNEAPGECYGPWLYCSARTALHEHIEPGEIVQVQKILLSEEEMGRIDPESIR